MGVSGTGKTTVGQALALQLGWVFCDADDFHSAAAIAKMRRGLGLTDHDRAEWLEVLRYLIRYWCIVERDVVLACSVLKQQYRKILLDSYVANQVVTRQLIYLRIQPAIAHKRLQYRQNHFVDEQLLFSQFQALEEPGANENPLIIDVDDLTATEIVRQIRKSLHLEH
jgi:gluconokinase